LLGRRDDAAWDLEDLVEAGRMRADEELAVLRVQVPIESVPARLIEGAANLPDQELAAQWSMAVELYLEGDLWDRSGDHRRTWAAAVGVELAHRVQDRVQVMTTDPPAYVTGLVGPCPGEEEFYWRWAWLDGVTELERYRLVAGVTDRTVALGPAPPPDSSWLQCWRREVGQNLLSGSHVWMRDQHRIIGTPQDREQLLAVVTSTSDPWLVIRPDAGMVEESRALATGELRRRMMVAAPLLLDSRPENHADELRQAQIRHADLLRYRSETATDLADATERRDAVPPDWTRYAVSPCGGTGGGAAAH
jgi:hypothetical protein